MHGVVSCDLHGGGLVNSRVDQVADGRAAKVVGDETRVFIPLLARFLPKFYFNTRLVLLLAEDRQVEYRAALAEQLLEHLDEFLWQGQGERLTVLDDSRS